MSETIVCQWEFVYHVNEAPGIKKPCEAYVTLSLPVNTHGFLLSVLQHSKRLCLDEELHKSWGTLDDLSSSRSRTIILSDATWELLEYTITDYIRCVERTLKDIVCEKRRRDELKRSIPTTEQFVFEL